MFVSRDSSDDNIFILILLAECEDLACEQLCVLDPLTGARCLCGEGYVPEDNYSISCKRKFVSSSLINHSLNHLQNEGQQHGSPPLSI